MLASFIFFWFISQRQFFVARLRYIYYLARNNENYYCNQTNIVEKSDLSNIAIGNMMISFIY